MVNIIASEEKFDNVLFEEFCSEKGFEFPEYMIDFMTVNNDCEFGDNYIEVDGEKYSIKYMYGATKENYSSIVKQYEEYLDRIPEGLVPIGRDEFDNQICIAMDSDHYGEIYFWDHEFMEPIFEEETELEINQMPLLANNFNEFIHKLIEV